MQTVAQSAKGEYQPTIRDASLLWCKSLLEQKAAEARSARRRLAAYEAGVAAVVMAMFAGWIRWNWPAIEASLNNLGAALVPQLLSAAAWWLVPTSDGAWSLSTMLMLVLGGVAALLASYPLLSEE
jgi:hypothetical protein